MIYPSFNTIVYRDIRNHARICILVLKTAPMPTSRPDAAADVYQISLGVLSLNISNLLWYLLGFLNLS